MLSTLLGHLADVARHLDKVPVTPANVADRLLEDWFARREKLASADPIWVHTRTEGTHDGTISLEAWRIMRAIEDQLQPEPDWLDWLRHMRTWTLAGGIRQLQMRAQMAERGWSDADIWNLEHTLCRRLADQLDELANTAWGWPGNDEFPTYDDWTTALREQAAKLRRVDHGPDHTATLDAWHAAFSVDPDSETTTALGAALDQIEADDTQAVTEALTWVATHHRHLWD